MLYQSFSFFLFLVYTLSTAIVWGIKFDLPAAPEHSVVPKCISQYVTTNTLVVVTVKVGVGYNQKIDVEVTDNSDANNKYGHKRDINEETRLAFTTHANADISVCFTNTLDEEFQPNPQYHRMIDLDIDIGAEAIDPNQFEKLKPMEAELRKLEQVVQEIVDEMDYLRQREARMRDTNESTNERVKWFSLGTMFVLVCLGFWQIVYLKKFFQRKRLID
ncbi:25248_t:CDS:2 [Dentiscutata erythropus]|uniref:25248_t:CDS:1 n=1 Tax=Dentiscutata erythropus TaxID=1348616 RepID=A0A9N9I1X1_9GLOM|nr:25248_t:CDS:2 [Dentiscutata erythropus]